MTNNQNDGIHPKIFISPLENNQTNQHLYRTNYMTQFIEQQQRVNDKITNSFSDVYNVMKDSKTEQHQYFEHLISQIDKQEHTHVQFRDRMLHQEQASHSILDRVLQLETLNHEIRKKLESDDLIHQAIIDGLTSQDHFGQQVSQGIKENENMLDSIISQLARQEELYQQLTEKIGLQDAFHQTIIERLDHQEALTQKITRQIDHLKSVIFERFSFITEKIENSLKFTSNYLFSFMTKGKNKQEHGEMVENTEEYTKHQ
jgi:hypothetical protein